jgi:acetolactate synthase-1/3 small subunit
VAPPQQGDDVYAYEPQPLEEGVRKHMLSVFVADEPGLINRVAGVFARRGANIESLAVGLTVDKALFTIVATGTDATVANLSKQIAKLVNVRYVENITDESHVERELILVKVHAPPGPTRTEVMQIAEIFRAHAVDTSERTLTLQTTGDVGKIEAFKKSLSKFGLIELVRTGRISLKRGERVFDTGAWMPRQPGRPHPAVEQPPIHSGDGDIYDSAAVLDAAYDAEKASVVGEPYVLCIEVQDVPGVLNQVTGVFARRGYNVQSLAVGNSEREGMSRITMVVPASSSGIANLIKQLNKLVYVEKVGASWFNLLLNFGVWGLISWAAQQASARGEGVAARFSQNCLSGVAGGLCRPAGGRCSVCFPQSGCCNAQCEIACRELHHLPDIHPAPAPHPRIAPPQVEELTLVPHVSRELMLIKVNCSASQRGELVSLASIFRALVCDVSVNTLTLEVTGKEDKMVALKEVLEPYGILEVARTGRVCMQRDSGLDSKYLGRVAGSRVML